jgi:hypothetical protein
VQTSGAKCILGANPGWLGAQAIKLAVDILDGNKPADRHVLVNADFLTTDPIDTDLYPDNDTMQKLEIGKTAFPDLSPGLTLPISPDWMESRLKRLQARQRLFRSACAADEPADAALIRDMDLSQYPFRNAAASCAERRGFSGQPGEVHALLGETVPAKSVSSDPRGLGAARRRNDRSEFQAVSGG